MKTKLLVLGIVVLCFGAGPAVADLYLDVDVSFTNMTITPTGAGMASVAISDSDYSSVAAYLWDDAGTSGSADDILMDEAYIMGGSYFDALLNLTFTRAASEVWSASGPVIVRDTTFSDVIAGNFTSTLIDIPSTSTDLYVHGRLSPIAPSTSILPTSPWVFAGQAGPDGSDGVAGQVILDPADYFDAGIVTVLHYHVGTGSLDALLSTSDSFIQGDVSMTVVPVPAAFLLAMLGMGVAGLKLRKHA